MILAVVACVMAAAIISFFALALAWGARTGDALFDRRPCPHCGAPSARGTACLGCGTWVGR